MASIEKMTDEELQDYAYSLQHEKDTLKEEQLSVRTELDTRAAKAKAEELLDGMTDLQKDVLIKGVTASAASKGVVS